MEQTKLVNTEVTCRTQIREVTGSYPGHRLLNYRRANDFPDIYSLHEKATCVCFPLHPMILNSDIKIWEKETFMLADRRIQINKGISKQNLLQVKLDDVFKCQNIVDTSS